MIINDLRNHTNAIFFIKEKKRTEFRRIFSWAFVILHLSPLPYIIGL